MRNDTSKPSRWRRKVLGIPVAWLVGIASTGLAIAGFFVLLNVTGTVTVRNGIDVIYTAVLGPPGPAGGSGTQTCSFTLTNPETVNLVMGNAFPGDACEYKVEVKNNGAVPAYYTGFTVSNPNLIAKAPVGPDGCGATVPAAGGTKEVRVRITVAPTALPGSTLNFAVGDGFNFGVNNVTTDPTCS